MNVAAILAEKGHRVITVSAEASLADVVRSLAQHGIGAAVVTRGEGQIAGILSERDIIRALHRQGAAALEEPAGSIMTRDVVTCGIQSTVLEVMHQMTAGRFRHVPVVNHGRLVGIISIGDVVKHRIAEVEHDANELRAYIATA